VADPVIIHEPTKEYGFDPGHRIYSDVKKARLKQTVETSLEDRIEYASWPETLAYLEPVWKDRRYRTDRFEEAFRYSFRRYLNEWTAIDPDDLEEPLCYDPGLSEEQTAKLAEFQYGLKKDRDKYFVDQVYEDLAVNTVPEDFWLDYYEQQADQTQPNEYSQDALATLTDR